MMLDFAVSFSPFYMWYLLLDVFYTNSNIAQLNFTLIKFVSISLGVGQVYGNWDQVQDIRSLIFIKGLR